MAAARLVLTYALALSHSITQAAVTKLLQAARVLEHTKTGDTTSLVTLDNFRDEFIGYLRARLSVHARLNPAFAVRARLCNQLRQGDASKEPIDSTPFVAAYQAICNDKQWFKKSR